MTARELVQLWQKRRADFDREFMASSRGLATSMVRFDKEKMTEEIYSLPEDRTAKGKKKWRRTGALRRAERFEVPDPYTILIINDMNYAEPRHEAGKPSRRGINPLRESHWRDELVETFRPIVLDVRRETLLAILRQGKG